MPSCLSNFVLKSAQFSGVSGRSSFVLPSGTVIDVGVFRARHEPHRHDRHSFCPSGRGA